MADDNTAPSSIAEPEVASLSLADLSSEQYDQWRMTGDLPKAKPAESLPATEIPETPDQSGESKGTQETGKGKNLKTRTAELDGEIQDLKAKLAARDELKRLLSEPGGKTDSPTAPEKPAELKAPVKPKVEDFATWEQYEDARDQYREAMADLKIQTAIQSDRAERAKQAEREKQEAEGKTVAERWNKQIEAAAKKHSDWEKAAEAVADIAKDPRLAAAANAVLDAEDGTEILHYLGTHLDEFEALKQMSPTKQIRALTLIEATLTKPAAKATPGPKKVTEVPPPPTELGARNQLPPDPVEAALESGDTGAYIEAANARDIAQGRRAFR